MSGTWTTTAALAFLTACDGPKSADGPAVVDSAGVTIVTSTDIDRPLPWNFTEEFRIGGADSGAGSFSTVSPALVETNRRDRIMVFDRDRKMVEVFDSNGALVSSFGRPGTGPGEISFAIELIDAGADEIAVFDYSKMALVRWALTGTVLPEWRIPPAVRVIRGDTTWSSIQIIDSTRTVTGVSLGLPGDTLALDTVTGPPSSDASFSCVSMPLPPMFSGRLVWDHEEGVVALTRQSEYLVQVFEGKRLVRSIRRPIAPIPTTPSMAERQYPDGWIVNFSNAGQCVIDPQEVADKAGMARYLPVVNEVAFGPRQTLWVQRFAFPGDSAVTDVFDHEGSYLGSVTGRGLPLGWLGADRVLFPIEDATTGVSVIGVYRIGGAGEDAEAP